MSVTLTTHANLPIDLKWWTFTGGERNVKILSSLGSVVEIRCDFQTSDDLIDLLLLTNAIRHLAPTTSIQLFIPYFPYARQDRVMTSGEPLAVQCLAQLLATCNFSRIKTWDAHSDVVLGMFAPGLLEHVPQWILWHDILTLTNAPQGTKALISPDAGAAKKIYKLAKAIDCEVIEATKHRNVQTGEITKTTLDTQNLDNYTVLYVLDDICDGGRTFSELAKVIREAGYRGKLILCVTHGIFSKGLEPLRIFDEIHTLNNINNADIAAFNQHAEIKPAQHKTRLILRTCNTDLTSYNGFQWPADGLVQAPDFEATYDCGHGLHGLLEGKGDGNYLDWSPEARWLVVEVKEHLLLTGQGELCDKCKFPEGNVVHCGTQASALDYLQQHGIDLMGCVGATITTGEHGRATVGDYGTATAGHFGTATAGYKGRAVVGNYGTATAGYCGTATTGHRGTATADNSGTATAGDYGKATAGEWGTVIVGKHGNILCTWYDTITQSRRTTVGYAGENGIKANTPYQVDATGKFIQVGKQE